MGERPDLTGSDRYTESIVEVVDTQPDPFLDAGMESPYRSTTVTPPPYETADEIDAQRAQVEQTRAEMGDTIDAIQEKLSPSNIAGQVKESVKGATVGKVQDAMGTATQTVQNAVGNATDTVASAGDSATSVGSGIVETIKQNPVPAAIAGFGLGWLIVSARSQNGSSQVSGYRPALDPYAPPSFVYGEQETQGPIGQAQDAAQQAVGQAQDAAQQAVSQVQSQASQVGTQVQQQASQAVGGFQQMMRQNPLAIAAVAIAVGAAVGLALPESPPENQLMGEARENLMQKAQQTAQQTAEKAQSVAQEAIGAATQEAKKSTS